MNDYTKPIDQHIAQFWRYLDAELTREASPEAAVWLPQTIANLIDEYRWLGMAILRDADRNPAFKAKLDRARAVSAAAPLRWDDAPPARRDDLPF